MQFTLQGQLVIWQGKMVEKTAIVHVLQREMTQQSSLEKLLAEFVDLFQEPQGLPPSRGCDHRITLVAGTEPIVVRTYRYPHR